MTVFILKIIAMIAMVCDHIRYAIPATNRFPIEYIGRIAFPIFAFLISEGFVHTHSKPKYLLRMLVFAIISQLPFYLFAHVLLHSTVKLNVMFTFELALVGLYIFEYFENEENLPKIFTVLINLVLSGLILAIAYVIHPDYTWYGILCIWIFYYLKKHLILMSIAFSGLSFLYYGVWQKIIGKDLLYCLIFLLISLLLMLLYNGKEGKKIKYFFYLFYPIHLLILYFIGINF